MLICNLKTGYSPKTSDKTTTPKIAKVLRSGLKSTTDAEDESADEDDHPTTEVIASRARKCSTAEGTGSEHRNDQAPEELVSTHNATKNCESGYYSRIIRVGFEFAQEVLRGNNLCHDTKVI
ncbi:hypothetical protein KEM55_000810 [Ascosphaera atra]|nr:hypothetical protein KEM55_000810 [Ascosphaera atra]